MTDRHLTAAEMELFLSQGMFYDSMSLKMSVRDIGEIEIGCSPGELRFSVEYEYE